MQGWIEGDFVFVGPDETGRVETLSVREGDQVAAGAPLFSVDADLQQADVNTTSAQVAEARERLRRLEAAQQRKEEIAVMEAQEKRAEAMLQLSTAEFDRQQQLTARSVGTQAAARHREGEFQSRQGCAGRGSPANGGGTALGARGGHRGRAPDARGRGGRRSSAETKLARRKLVSPVSGAVQQIYFRPGEMVPAGRPVLSILPPGNIKVRFFVGEAVSAEGRARRHSRGHVRRLRQADLCARELHRALGRIHAAGDLQPRRAQQARLHDRGAHRDSRRACASGSR